MATVDGEGEFKEIGEFFNGRVEVDIEEKMKIEALRIRALAKQDNWLLIREIAVWT